MNHYVARIIQTSCDVTVVISHDSCDIILICFGTSLSRGRQEEDLKKTTRWHSIRVFLMTSLWAFADLNRQSELANLNSSQSEFQPIWILNFRSIWIQPIWIYPIWISADLNFYFLFNLNLNNLNLSNLNFGNLDNYLQPSISLISITSHSYVNYIRLKIKTANNISRRVVETMNPFLFNRLKDTNEKHVENWFSTSWSDS